MMLNFEFMSSAVTFCFLLQMLMNVTTTHAKERATVQTAMAPTLVSATVATAR